jgi:hypothetical protein
VAFQRLPESVLTLYAELLEQSIHAEAEAAALGIPAGGPPGSFIRKEVKGRTYWYLQVSEGGSRRQHYLGADSDALRAWMAEVRETRDVIAQDDAGRARLCRMLKSGGAFVQPASSVRVLELLAGASVFRFGGVLVGTHAFSVYGNMLGVRFEDAALRTQDVDVAQDPVIGIALLARQEPVDVDEVLRGSDLKFHAVPSLDSRRPSTSYKIRGREMRVDFLTPLVGRTTGKPVFLPAFRVSAHPLRMLDYLLKDAGQAVFAGKRAVLVNVPDPARFALHKLWTSRSRDATWRVKARKDVVQAAHLLEILLEDQPEDVIAAWQALAERPRALQRVRRAAEGLEPSLREQLPL